MTAEAKYLRVAAGPMPCWRDDRTQPLNGRTACASDLAAVHGGYVCSLPSGHEGTHVAGVGKGLVTAEWTDHYSEVQS